MMALRNWHQDSKETVLNVHIYVLCIGHPFAALLFAFGSEEQFSPLECNAIMLVGKHTWALNG